MNEKVIVKTEGGEIVEATAPVIISASRSTDIPAFFAKWFFNRLAKGYCMWYNPFNQQPMYISFNNCKRFLPLSAYKKKLFTHKKLLKKLFFRKKIGRPRQN